VEEVAGRFGWEDVQVSHGGGCSRNFSTAICAIFRTVLSKPCTRAARWCR
jgi:hypothetical protein